MKCLLYWRRNIFNSYKKEYTMKTAMKITLLCASIIVQPMMMRADDHDKK